MRMLIIDDHPLTCKGLAALLVANHACADVSSVHSAATARSALKIQPAFDWLFLDIHLPDDVHHHLFAELCRSGLIGRTILISAEPEHGLIQAALAAGARGFLPKTADPEIVLSGFAKILEGEVFVPPDLARRPLGPPTPAMAFRGLSPRLLQVQQLLLQGASNKVIAKNLSLSNHTVKEYVSSVLAFHGAASRLDMLLKVRHIVT